ncbi:unnamed protein product [Owenia fusiformis]|uniref:Uncharacterized protein n=1 Tax=Owenia fusiformis TaxID=6347 RepID=A0A8S4QAX5_OWEFU|nr:unnamed protein product [Owenia fusiformis]
MDVTILITLKRQLLERLQCETVTNTIVKHSTSNKPIVLDNTNPTQVIHLIEADVHVAGCFTSLLTQNDTYRHMFTQHWIDRSLLNNKAGNQQMTDVIVVIQSSWPNQCILDYKWSYRVCRLVCNSILIQDAMAWLSTLGGGYSALGDHFQHHAQEAGRISNHQFKIALELGDPGLTARCRIYLAQSLMQQGCLKQARNILRSQYEVAVKRKSTDPKLVNMCKGVWNRLKYLHSQRLINSYKQSPVKAR